MLRRKRQGNVRRIIYDSNNNIIIFFFIIIINFLGFVRFIESFSTTIHRHHHRSIKSSIYHSSNAKKYLLFIKNNNKKNKYKNNNNNIGNFRFGSKLHAHTLIATDGPFIANYLSRELLDKNHHDVTVYTSNRDMKLKRLPGETAEGLKIRREKTIIIKGIMTDSRKVAKCLDKLKDIDVLILDKPLNATIPLVETMKNKIQHLVYLSSGEVYSDREDIINAKEMALLDGTSEKANVENFLKSSCEGNDDKSLPYTIVRSATVYGALNDNSFEEFFFKRLCCKEFPEDLPFYVPGLNAAMYGGSNETFTTGLVHIKDLVSGIGEIIKQRNKTIGKIYNLQNLDTIKFDDILFHCAEAARVNWRKTRNLLYYNRKKYYFGDDPEDGGYESWPIQIRNLYLDVENAMNDLHWEPKVNFLDGLKESYRFDFLKKKKAGKLKFNFNAEKLISKTTFVPFTEEQLIEIEPSDDMKRGSDDETYAVH